tara:strand:- start:1147 stop:1365 length:219 start_codon:yes stop_codon:yes gene_type:complete
MSVSRRNRLGHGLQAFANTIMADRIDDKDDDRIDIESIFGITDFDPTKLRELGSGLYSGNDMNSLISKIFGK